MLRFHVLIVAVLGALVLVPGPARADSQAAASPADHGAQVYVAQKCSICHSVAGVGNKKLTLDGVGTKLSADEMREWIVTPIEAAKKAQSTAKPLMRAYPKLAKADLDALVAYLKTLEKK